MWALQEFTNAATANNLWALKSGHLSNGLCYSVCNEEWYYSVDNVAAVPSSSAEEWRVWDDPLTVWWQPSLLLHLPAELQGIMWLVKHVCYPLVITEYAICGYNLPLIKHSFTLPPSHSWNLYAMKLPLLYPVSNYWPVIKLYNIHVYF